jgi:hypothetical protein
LHQLIHVGEERNPRNLEFDGLKLWVEISTASIDAENAPLFRKTFQGWALVDSGAYRTHISEHITEYLKLDSIGEDREVGTAGGRITSKDYAIDIKFLNLNLNPFLNLNIGSIGKKEDDHFNLEKAFDNEKDKRNYGIWLGRDILSRWNLNWDGPTSTVAISD